MLCPQHHHRSSDIAPPVPMEPPFVPGRCCHGLFDWRTIGGNSSPPRQFRAASDDHHHPQKASRFLYCTSSFRSILVTRHSRHSTFSSLDILVIRHFSFLFDRNLESFFKTSSRLISNSPPHSMSYLPLVF